MFVRVKLKSNGKKSIQIVESYRRADKVSQKIVRHVGQAANEREVEELTRLAKSIIVEMETQRQPCLPFIEPTKLVKELRSKKKKSDDSIKIKNLREEQRVINGIGEVFGKLYKDLGFDKIIKGTNKDEQWNNILESCALARIANPASKRRTASLLEEDYGIKIPLEKIYRAMDHVADRELDIKKRIAQTTLSLFKEQVDVLFFDVTTLYFESTTSDELRAFGFSKDCKFKEVQIMLALVTTTNGMPITYKIFPGNTCEGNTLIEMVKELQNEYLVKNILLVADRAMFNDDNLALMEQLNIQYIVAAKLKTLPKKLKTDILHSEYKFDVIANEPHWVNEFTYKSRRLVVSYSSKRARKDAADRQRLVDRLMKKVRGGKIKIRELIPNHGSKKYIKIENDNAFINRDKINDDAQWDGLHGIITNAPAAEKTPSKILSRYRELWQIEEAFRISKHDLKMRPVFHWTGKRIRAHISICFIAFTLAKQAIYRIAIQQAPMSFEQIRNELLHAQSSIIVDLSSRKKYVIPSHVTVSQKKIYQAFGLRRSQVPHELT
jgi:transposase